MIVLKSRRNGGDLLAFGPDSRMLAARSETGLQLWRDHSGAKPTIFRELTSTASIQFTPDGESLVFDGSESGIINLRTNEIRFFTEPDGYRYFSMTPDGSRLIAVFLPPDRSKNFIACWTLADAFDGDPLWKIPLPRRFGGRPIMLADARFIVDEDDEGYGMPMRYYCYVIRSGSDGRVEGEMDRLHWYSERTAASPNGRWLAGQNTNELRIWDAMNLKSPPLEITTGSRKIFTDVAAHPSGRWLAACGTDGTVKYFESATWSVDRTYTWGIGKMVGIAFSPDGLLAAAGSDKGRIVIWDVEQ